MHRCISLALLLIVLIGCGARAEPSAQPKSLAAPTRTPAAAPAEPTIQASPPPPSGWTQVDWEGLRIAYPPDLNPIFKPLAPEPPLRAVAELAPTCPLGQDCQFPMVFRIHMNDGGDAPTWVERNHREGYRDVTPVTVDGRAGIRYEVGSPTAGLDGQHSFYVFSHGTDILEIELGNDFGHDVIAALDFDPAPAAGLAAGQLAYLSAPEALDVWDAASGGQRVVEHPKLHPGSQVAIVQMLADAVHIRTMEGTAGWLRQPASQILSREDVGNDQIARFGEGSQVTIVHPTGIPLRQLPNSASGKIREKLATGTTALVYDVRGDWLYLILDDGAVGWARWYYDGQIYIQ